MKRKPRCLNIAATPLVCMVLINPIPDGGCGHYFQHRKNTRDKKKIKDKMFPSGIAQESATVMA